MKTCSCCGIDKSGDEFYPATTKCKVCTCAAVRRNRLANLDAVRAYDRKRAKLPHRIASATRVTREWRREHRDRQKAQNAAARAKLVGPAVCEGCGLDRPLNKHHHDYSRPLAVIWLCKPCHCVADKIRRLLEKKVS